MTPLVDGPRTVPGLSHWPGQGRSAGLITPPLAGAGQRRHHRQRLEADTVATPALLSPTPSGDRAGRIPSGVITASCWTSPTPPPSSPPTGRAHPRARTLVAGRRRCLTGKRLGGLETPWRSPSPSEASLVYPAKHFRLGRGAHKTLPEQRADSFAGDYRKHKTDENDSQPGWYQIHNHGKLFRNRSPLPY